MPDKPQATHRYDKPEIVGVLVFAWISGVEPCWVYRLQDLYYYGPRIGERLDQSFRYSPDEVSSGPTPQIDWSRSWISPEHLKGVHEVFGPHKYVKT